MRTLEELYTILHDYFNRNSYAGDQRFICHDLHQLYLSRIITATETVELHKNFLSNRPTEKLHVEFYENPLYSKKEWNWFGDGYESYKLRNKFLYYLIKNHKNEKNTIHYGSKSVSDSVQ